MDELVTSNETSKEVENIEENTAEENHIFLPSGQTLSIKETYEITATEKSKLIMLLGAVGSGKTAVITSIYNSFLHSPISNDYYFAGSKTLYDFEDRAFNTRTISKMSSPKHARTYKGTFDILHIRVKDIIQNRFTNMLFTDFSGEEYETAIGNINYVKTDFTIVKAASSLAVLLDGEKLSKPRTRNSEIQRSIQLLRTFNDSGLIKYNVPIILVVSKFDLITKAKWKDLKEMIDSQFVSQLPILRDRIMIQEVAPLSENKDIVCIGHGIQKLFGHFLFEELRPQKQLDLPFTNSQFDVWGRRVMNED